MGLSAWPNNVLPWQNAGTVAHNPKLLMFRGLLGYGADGAMQGELAESWRQDSETEWTFRLRQALFHNGQPVTSDDVRYTIEQIAAERSTAYMKGEMQRVARLETPDARTVRVIMREPSVVVPNLFASYYTPIVARGSADGNAPGIGAGPFTMGEQERGVFLELKAFDRFYRPGLPKLKSVRMVAYADEDLRVAALRSGDVDLIEYVPWAAMKSIEADPALRLVTTEGPFMHMYFNAKSPPFGDARVRLAAALAVKRQDIVDSAFFGRARPLEGIPFAPGSAFFDERRSHGFAYDPARARALLAEAGHAAGFTCKLLTTSTYGMIKSTAEVIQNNLAAIGIQAELMLPDWATRIAMGNRGQYDIAGERHDQREQRSRQPQQLHGDQPAPQLHPRLWPVVAEAGRVAGRRAPDLRSGAPPGGLCRAGAVCAGAGADGGPGLARPGLCDAGRRAGLHEHAGRAHLLFGPHARDDRDRLTLACTRHPT